MYSMKERTTFSKCILYINKFEFYLATKSEHLLKIWLAEHETFLVVGRGDLSYAIKAHYVTD